MNVHMTGLVAVLGAVASLTASAPAHRSGRRRGRGDCVAAGAGNDRVFSRDSTRDVIGSGPGHDTAIADAVDRTRRGETVRRARPR